MVEGWYRSKEGLYELLSKQRAQGAGRYQRSAQKALKKTKIFNGIGKIFF